MLRCRFASQSGLRASHVVVVAVVMACLRWSRHDSSSMLSLSSVFLKLCQADIARGVLPPKEYSEHQADRVNVAPGKDAPAEDIVGSDFDVQDAAVTK